MATFSSLYPYNPMLFVPTSSSNYHFASSFLRRTKFIVLSSHSNPKILKTNRKSIYGKTLSPYDSDEENDEMDDEDDDEDEDDDDDDEDWFSDDEEFAEPADLDPKVKRLKSKTLAGRQQEKENGVRSLYNGQSNRLPKSRRIASLQENNSAKFGRNYKEKRYPELSDVIALDVNWLPLLDYLSTFGIKESQFVQIYERHMASFQINVYSAQERVEYLLSLGVKHTNIRRILLRQPQILEYTVENNLKTHVAFLMGLGVPSSKLGQIIASTPSIFSYSVENSLKPTVRYLIEEVGIKEKDLGKVIQLSPQILVQRIDISWNARFMFLTKELGAPKESIVKMVTKHPQLLHYSIDDGLLPRINFLRSIGMKNADILKILTSLTQVLSLSLEANLKPKYLYLVNELRNEVKSLTKYPMYLSLSLDQRIRPRHTFLVSLKKAPKGPFPLGSLVPTDEAFCQQWAGTTLDKYLAFRNRLLLKKFADKYDKNVKR
ncbi:transcription termination factor MTERF9, chloroplastic [Trifolium pratense]|uniref:transcription termination factor MTERF9, chloroplastic n=1 Tax=Trifolium pratense TaxID=57577 RepID=UPI001E6981C5|nr:transcription termination factor MTERF9, chloroplastic [Trifolium pratense]